MLVAEQVPERYLPLAQPALEHAAHCVLLVEEQALVWYLPDPHVPQTEQVEPVVPKHPPLLYLPLPHVSHARQS